MVMGSWSCSSTLSWHDLALLRGPEDLLSMLVMTIHHINVPVMTIPYGMTLWVMTHGMCMTGTLFHHRDGP